MALISANFGVKESERVRAEGRRERKSARAKEGERAGVGRKDPS